jgi:hypothetical protein
MKKFILVLALLVLLAFTGSVMATNVGSTDIIATINQGTITVTAPPAATWALDKANPNNNQIQLNNANIAITGFPTTQTWEMSVSGSNNGKLTQVYNDGFGAIHLNNAALISNGGSFVSLASPVVMASGSGNTNTPVGVYLQQVMVQEDDSSQTYKLILTFTGSVT